MSFRRRLLLLFALTVLLSIAAVTITISTLTGRAFDRANDERAAALVSQFRRGFDNRGADVDRRIQSIAAGAEANRMLVAAAQSAPDYSPFLESAEIIAQAQRLDFLEFADERGTIISSAQWPAKFGYTDPLVAKGTPTAPFLKQEELPTGPALGLFAARSISAADRRLYMIGGVRLNKSFLGTIEPPAGMSVMLYENLVGGGFSLEHLIYNDNAANPDAQQLGQIIQRTLQDPRESSGIVRTNSGDETVNAFPLRGANDQVLGVLLISSSRQIYSELRGQIRGAALSAASAGLVLAVLLSSWAAGRVTKPVKELANAAHDIATGNLTSTVNVNTHDELGELADAFNRMTRDLLEHRERLIQAERVAAWRELARRLAHELKNPLFPLQLTVENLLHAREQGQQQFDETFRESATTLLAEISNLKNIVARFSDFSRMPAPQFQPVNVKELLESVAKLHQAQLTNSGINCKIEVSAEESISADADLLHRALSNLVLNAIDAMPNGGALTLRSEQQADSIRIAVSDTGSGLTQQETANLFTPYYTTKSQGTGLGLAVVQSIVSDHGGRISVTSEPGRGTTFMIDLLGDGAANGRRVSHEISQSNATNP